MMTDAHKDLVMTVDDEAMMNEMTDVVADLERPTPAAASHGCHAAQNGGTTATVRLLARDLEVRSEPANVPLLEAAAIPHAQGAPKISIDTCLAVAKSAKIAANVSTQTDASEKETIVGIESETIAVTANVILADLAAVMTAAIAHAATGLENTIAGMQETGPPGRTGKLEVLGILPNVTADSRTPIVIYPALMVMTRRIQTVKASVIVKRRRGAGAEIETETGSESVTEILEGVAVDQGVVIGETVDVISNFLGLYYYELHILMRATTLALRCINSKKDSLLGSEQFHLGQPQRRAIESHVRLKDSMPHCS